ncbi:MAG: hypothetical protein MZV64_35630 [Ignavibacteriales bacterium]|nr:hypothetical protein [Ignavibacteriales bacterium]
MAQWLKLKQFSADSRWQNQGSIVQRLWMRSRYLRTTNTAGEVLERGDGWVSEAYDVLNLKHNFFRRPFLHAPAFPFSDVLL